MCGSGRFFSVQCRSFGYLHKSFPAFIDCKEVMEDAALELMCLEKLVEKGTERLVTLPNKAMCDVSRFVQWPHLIQ